MFYGYFLLYHEGSFWGISGLICGNFSGLCQTLYVRYPKEFLRRQCDRHSRHSVQCSTWKFFSAWFIAFLQMGTCKLSCIYIHCTLSTFFHIVKTVFDPLPMSWDNRSCCTINWSGVLSRIVLAWLRWVWLCWVLQLPCVVAMWSLGQSEYYDMIISKITKHFICR